MDRITRLVGRSRGAAPRTRLWNVAASALATCAVVVAVGCFRAASAPEETPPGAGDVSRTGEATLSFGVPDADTGGSDGLIWEAEGNRMIDLGERKALDVRRHAETEQHFGDPDHRVTVELVDPESGETSVYKLEPTGNAAFAELRLVEARRIQEFEEQSAARAAFGDARLHEESEHEVLIERKEAPESP